MPKSIITGWGVIKTDKHQAMLREIEDHSPEGIREAVGTKDRGSQRTNPGRVLENEDCSNIYLIG